DEVEQCRDDLLQVDAAPIGLSFTASADAIVLGEPIDATLCTTEASSVLALDTGTHTITSTAGTSTPGTSSGFHVDQVVLAEHDDGAASAATPAPTVTVTSSSRTDRTVEVAPC